MMKKWNELLKKIPKDVILKKDSEKGIILLSWAKIDEICPPNCPAPLDFCPHHQREKSQTITQISKKIQISDVFNLTIESYQVKPGLGIIYGQELKNKLVELLRYIQLKKRTNSLAIFFVSTTCNCHGVLNMFSL
jgi:hypothetical protein